MTITKDQLRDAFAVASDVILEVKIQDYFDWTMPSNEAELAGRLRQLADRAHYIATKRESLRQLLTLDLQEFFKASTASNGMPMCTPHPFLVAHVWADIAAESWLSIERRITVRFGVAAVARRRTNHALASVATTVISRSLTTFGNQFLLRGEMPNGLMASPQARIIGLLSRKRLSHYL